MNTGADVFQNQVSRHVHGRAGFLRQGWASPHAARQVAVLFLNRESIVPSLRRGSAHETPPNHLGPSLCQQRTPPRKPHTGPLCGRLRPAFAASAAMRPSTSAALTNTAPPPRPRPSRRALPRASSATASTPSIGTSIPGSGSPSTSSAAPRPAPDRDRPIHLQGPRRGRVRQEPDHRAAVLRALRPLPRRPLRQGHLPQLRLRRRPRRPVRELRQAPRPHRAQGTPSARPAALRPIPASTTHLYIDLPAIKPKLEAWMKEASRRAASGTNNAIQMTQAWIRDGLKERAITRDLKWGIPVPKPGFEDKVFYVWFDAPIGYISITATAGDEKGFDWKSWWHESRRCRAFPVHREGQHPLPYGHLPLDPPRIGDRGGPCSTTCPPLSTSTTSLGKFSKSQGIGVFGNDAMESGIAADVVALLHLLESPREERLHTFTWGGVPGQGQRRAHRQALGNPRANRTLTFVSRYYGGVIPEAASDEAFWKEARAIEDLDSRQARAVPTFATPSMTPSSSSPTSPTSASRTGSRGRSAISDPPRLPPPLSATSRYVLRDLADHRLIPICPTHRREDSLLLRKDHRRRRRPVLEADVGVLEGLDKVVKIRSPLHEARGRLRCHPP